MEQRFLHNTPMAQRRVLPVERHTGSNTSKTNFVCGGGEDLYLTRSRDECQPFLFHMVVLGSLLLFINAVRLFQWRIIFINTNYVHHSEFTLRERQR